MIRVGRECWVWTRGGIVRATHITSTCVRGNQVRHASRVLFLVTSDFLWPFIIFCIKGKKGSPIFCYPLTTKGLAVKDEQERSKTTGVIGVCIVRACCRGLGPTVKIKWHVYTLNIGSAGDCSYPARWVIMSMALDLACA